MAVPTDIFFANDQYVIRFRGIYAGRKPQIEYRLWMKIQSLFAFGRMLHAGLKNTLQRTT